MEQKQIKFISRTITIIITLLLILFIIYGFREGLFTSNEKLVEYIAGYGTIGPIIFMLLQIVQVIFFFFSGGASCLVGVLAFGPIWGFIYNYVGLCLGSMVVFYLSRRYGLRLIRKLFSKETVDKYLGYIRTNKFNWIFMVGIFFPGAPDDLLCYIAGVSKMKWHQFIWVILLGKPLTLVFYSLFIDVLGGLQ